MQLLSLACRAAMEMMDRALPLRGFLFAGQGDFGHSPHAKDRDACCEGVKTVHAK